MLRILPNKLVVIVVFVVVVFVVVVFVVVEGDSGLLASPPAHQDSGA